MKMEKLAEAQYEEAIKRKDVGLDMDAGHDNIYSDSREDGLPFDSPDTLCCPACISRYKRLAEEHL